MSRKALLLVSVIVCQLIALTTILTIEALPKKNSTDNIENSFQQLVHGVGLGATTKPTWCYINFDPRIDPRCTCIEWPIPGGYCYCPDHTGTVSYMAGNVEMGVEIEIIRNDNIQLKGKMKVR